jgi:hydroxyacylglutathione hydrolase
LEASRKLKVQAFVSELWKEKTYVVSGSCGDALIIDPGSGVSATVAKYISEEKICPRGILLTHGHCDHIASVSDLQGIYTIPVFIHKLDSKLVSQANLYCVAFGIKAPIRVPTQLTLFGTDNNSLKVGSFDVSFLHSPGHTEGSVCFSIGTALFSGDTMLKGKIGRTDLPGGDPSLIAGSVKKIIRLPGSTKVYPGHGMPTTINEERRNLAEYL